MTRKLMRLAAVLVAAVGAAANAQISGTVTNATRGSSSSPMWAEGSLVQVSFVGNFVLSGAGPNPGIALPTAYRNQALEFTFDAPLDAGILSGFFIVGGSPVQLTGTGGTGVGVPYLPFVDQAGAKSSLQIRENSAAGALLPSYIVGRHATKTDTIVVDPFVPVGYPIPPSAGFNPSQEYVFAIPSANGFLFSGHPANRAGPTALPYVVTQTPSNVAGLFRSAFGNAPDLVPPAVISIAAQSGAAGTPANPILASDPIVVTFSKLVTGGSFDIAANFVVRNLNVTPATMPGGALVPGSIAPVTPGATADSVWIFTPAAPYGPGVSPAQGFDVEVRVGSFGQPASVVPPILGVPQGIAGTQLALSNSLAQVFRTTPCGGCPTVVGLAEGFDTTAQQDATFVQPFGPPNLASQPRWAHASAPGKLAGRLTTGSAAGTTPAALGSRIQILVDPMPPTPFPAGLFSPFDASAASSGGTCGPSGCNLGASINPNGGSHIMHLYESADLLNTEDSLEQVEWSPVNGVTTATTYPSYRIWCGLTSIAAPLAGGTGTGMTSVFDSNYNLTPYQTRTPIPAPCAAPVAINPRKVLCGGPMSYVVPLQVSAFMPFPLLSPCFDFATSTGVSGPGVNLLLEQNIESGSQAPNFNRFRATAFTPVRRLLDGPLSSVPPSICPFNHGGTFDIYRMRFTFVGISGQCRSLWYDTGVANPSYLGFSITPSVFAQPGGTQSTWILEGTDTLNPGPGTSGVSGTYINAAGTVFPLVLSNTLNQLRYFRFRVELRGNNVTNATPTYDSVVMLYSF